MSGSGSEAVTSGGRSRSLEGSRRSGPPALGAGAPGSCCCCWGAADGLGVTAAWPLAGAAGGKLGGSSLMGGSSLPSVAACTRLTNLAVLVSSLV